MYMNSDLATQKCVLQSETGTVSMIGGFLVPCTVLSSWPGAHPYWEDGS